ncbi:MAG: hypothetical protein JWL60_474 [Gemmatimonadetes bacterium]|nr:hypothetical protein [Gemmatimonadota bacterium]
MSGRRRVATLLLAAAVSAGSACRSEPVQDTDSGQLVHFDTSTVRLVGRRDSVTLRVELAVTPEQRTMGLMERHQLDERAGMLFVHDTIQSADAGFWMFRTLIPLDIAFLDESGVIRSIRTMTPCVSTLAQGCPTYAPGVPYRHALEVNAGFFARLGFAVGDSVDLRAARSRSKGSRDGG